MLTARQLADLRPQLEKRKADLREDIRQELLAKGVSEVVVDETLSGLAGSEVTAAREVWRRKFGEAPRSAAERARQIRFLQGRGFTLDTIMRVLKQRGEEDV